nr:TetR/AcrR family transcriptional regulator [Kibdelosporangium sp. MJ126-NF4]CEL13629.1 Transcriptional regulator, TetR family [Kibdelosporangium sp. MJ126-NF4]CTQ99315.1 Transcriptional regulator, TetR family [Kibdelosporangium sp. MJ126-NF4]
MTRLPRAQRREQILEAATEVVSRNGFAVTGLDDIAAAAGVTRMILYRHFESRDDLCRAVLDRAARRLAEAAGDDIGAASVRALVGWAAREPAAFRVLFRHAVHDPTFAPVAVDVRAAMVAEVHTRITEDTPPGPWTRWSAELAVSTCLEAVLAWLDVGAPDPRQAEERITTAVAAVVTA